MKKTALVLTLAFLVSVSVFAGGGAEAQPKAPKSTGPVEIVFLINSVKPYDTAIPEMMKKFEELNPDIKVKIEMMPTQNLWELVEIKLGAKESTPDALFTDSPLISSYVMKNYLEPLDSYFTDAEKAQYLDAARNISTVNGVLYSAPFVNSTQVLYYNTEIFDQMGVPRLSKDPKDRLTWEELVEVAKKVTIDEDKDGVPEVFGLGISQISRPYQMLTMPLSKGGANIGKDGLTVEGILTTDAWISATQFMSDLFNVYKVSPKGVSASDMLAYFPSGKVAMLLGPDYNAKAYSENKDLKWDYAPYPYFAGGKPVTPTGSWHLSINKNSKNKEAAAKLIKFLTLEEYNKDFFEMDGHLPTNRKTMEYIQSSEKYQTWPFDIFDLLVYESANTAVPRPASPGYLEYEQLLTNAFEDIRNGADPRQTLSDAEVRIDRMLQKYTR